MTGDSSSLKVGQIQNGIDGASFNLTQEELTQMG
jgi:hypothetical protein